MRPYGWREGRWRREKKSPEEGRPGAGQESGNCKEGGGYHGLRCVHTYDANRWLNSVPACIS